MLKRLAMLGLLILTLAGGTRSQVPWNGSGQHDKAQDKQDTADLSKPVIAVDSQHGANNQEQATEKPAKYPWRELAAPANIPNWFLVAVGAITGWFVYKTLKAIKRQADLMERQANEARGASAETTRIALATAMAAQKSADAANAQIRLMKDKGRARLAIRRVENPEIGAPESILKDQRPLWVRFFVQNIGPTKAFNVRASGAVEIISDPEKGEHIDGFIQEFPQIIDEGKELHRLSLAGFGIEFEDVASTSDFLSIPEKIVEQLRAGQIFLQASGLLLYEDIFGDTHRTPFRLVWKSRGNDGGGKWLDRSAWIDYSPSST